MTRGAARTVNRRGTAIRPGAANHPW